MNTLLMPKWSVLATGIRTWLSVSASLCLPPVFTRNTRLLTEEWKTRYCLFFINTLSLNESKRKQFLILRVSERSMPLPYIICSRKKYPGDHPMLNIYPQVPLKRVLPFVSISFIFAIKSTDSGVGLRLAGAPCPTFDCEMQLLFPVLPCLISSCVFSS